MFKPLPARIRRGLAATPARALILISYLLGTVSAAAAVPLPSVGGPLPHPVSQGIGVWSAAALDYTVGEYLLSGRANVYVPLSMADATDLKSRDNVRDLRQRARYAAQLKRPDVPYTTRIVVYAPKNRARFSGNVVLEIVHPQAGGRLVVWPKISGFFIAHGDAYVTLQHPLTFAALRGTDPARYGALRAADPTQLWDMVMQAGALIRSASRSNPLRGYRVRHLYLTGYSFTGVATATFADYFHDRARLANDAPIFDGYLPFANGMYVRPLDVPVIRVNTQSDFNSFGGLDNRGHDGDAASARYRLYEVAGATHVNDSPKIEPAATAPQREPRLPGAAGLPATEAACRAGFPHGAQQNTVPVNYVLAQAFIDMYRWVDDGVPPPHAPLIETDPQGRARLDRHGNALGGLRLPELLVPDATYGVGQGGLCWLDGYQLPFAGREMHELYGTRATYVSAVEHAARIDVDRGYISAGNAPQIVVTARAHRPF